MKSLIQAGRLPLSEAAARYEERETAGMKWRGYVGVGTTQTARFSRESLIDVTGVSSSPGEAELIDCGRL